MKMLNENINIDLHIHSYFSNYKDGDIVVNSTIENLDVLVTKLKENEISLCAITDHNRFSYDLYKALRDKIAADGGVIKRNLPGVEFDVVLEDGKPRCHIIAIFDDSDDGKVSEIEEKMFAVKRLCRDDEAYTLAEFEQIIRDVGIDVILIVHQRQAMSNTADGANSLSGSVSNPSEFIKVGFIDTLEYNYPRVEGIVKNSLREIGLSFPIITGSDCHDWPYYPYHDKTAKRVYRDFTKFKCLPTFKGLLMSITSFDTRSNRCPNSNRYYIESFSINGITYPLANGINAIIGDNGSGKTLLAGVLADKPEGYYKALIKENDVRIKYNDPSFQKSNVNYVSQGEVIRQVKSGSLFDDDSYFDDIKTKDIFTNQIREYFDDLCQYVNKEIKKQSLLNDLSNLSLSIYPIDKVFYYPVLRSDITMEDTTTDRARVDELNKIIKLLKLEIERNEDYYVEKKVDSKLDDALKILEGAQKVILASCNLKTLNNRVRSIIKDKLKSLGDSLDSKRTADETRKKRTISLYDDFKSVIVECARLQINKNKYPDFPQAIDGTSTKEYKGYRFCKTAGYHQATLKDAFYGHCFNKEYQCEEKIKTIKTNDEFSRALSYHDCARLNDYKKERLTSFINKYLEEVTTIAEMSSDLGVGNTPGEISLVYYRFTIQEADGGYTVLLIDQPEDDINPNRIKSYLNKYINSIRDTKQVIIITHNPLLVVNLDVDNVVHLAKVNNTIEVRSGPLEYECKDYSMLDLVSENLDGGYDAIERRLKAYGKYKN